MGDPVMTDSKIFVAGHRGLVGSAIVRNLEAAGHTGVMRAGRDQIDLVNQANVDSWFDENRPDFVHLVAGKVGGIMANSTYPAEFIYENLMIATNVIEASRKYGVKKLLYLGSSCIYPRMANQPMVEGELLMGELEKTNEPYALAKIAGIKLCEYYKKQFDCNFVSAMPTNLYGPHDNFDLENSHVLPALMRKFHEAKHAGRSGVEVWGTGSAMREFLYVDDLADACVFLMNNYDGEEHINVGTGTDVTIKELAETIRDVVHPEGELEFDTSKPDGTPRKLLDVSRLSELGWTAPTDLRTGIEKTYAWYLDNIDDLRGAATAGAH